MPDAAMHVLEGQVDELAQQVAHLREELDELRKTLSKPEVLERLGLYEGALDPYMAGLKASGKGWAHRMDRADAIKEATRKALLDRLERADGLSRLTGQSFAQALDEVSEND